MEAYARRTWEDLKKKGKIRIFVTLSNVSRVLTSAGNALVESDECKTVALLFLCMLPRDSPLQTSFQVHKFFDGKIHKH
jgi:hypothetical protein